MLSADDGRDNSADAGHNAGVRDLTTVGNAAVELDECSAGQARGVARELAVDG